jgi:hypothetical protein
MDLIRDAARSFARSLGYKIRRAEEIDVTGGDEIDRPLKPMRACTR